MAHENLKQYLLGEQGKRFVADLTRKVYTWASKVPAQYYNYRILDEVTIRYKTDEITRKGLDRNDHYRMDCVFLIQPGRSALNQGECYTVGVELKNSVEDLRADDKMWLYLGWTDYFYLGVPYDLVVDATEKIDAIVAAHPQARDKIGLFTVDQGSILTVPRKQLVSDEHRIALQDQIIYNYIFNDVKAVRFKLEDIEVEPAELRDEYIDCSPSTSTAHKEEYKEGEITSEVLLSTDDGGSPASEETPDVASPDQIQPLPTTQEPEPTPEELAEAKEKAKQQRAESAAKEAERLEHLAERGDTLPASTATLYNKLKGNSKEVFWAIVDGKVRRDQIAEATGMSLPTLDRALPDLLQAGLIRRDGSRKTGSFAVDVSIDKSAACETCKLADTCGYRGAALGNCAKHR